MYICPCRTYNIRFATRDNSHMTIFRRIWFSRMEGIPLVTCETYLDPDLSLLFTTQFDCSSGLRNASAISCRRARSVNCKLTSEHKITCSQSRNNLLTRARLVGWRTLSKELEQYLLWWVVLSLGSNPINLKRVYMKKSICWNLRSNPE